MFDLLSDNQWLKIWPLDFAGPPERHTIEFKLYVPDNNAHTRSTCVSISELDGDFKPSQVIALMDHLISG